MRYWLLKSEPETWSWDDQVKAGEGEWDGVRNAQALKNMRAMEVGDQALFYHSGRQRSVVGRMEITRTFYPDPEDPKGRYGQVDVKAVAPLEAPVTLKQIKAAPEMADCALVRQSRLSVVPLTETHWATILRLAQA